MNKIYLVTSSNGDGVFNSPNKIVKGFSDSLTADRFKEDKNRQALIDLGKHQSMMKILKKWFQQNPTPVFVGLDEESNKYKNWLDEKNNKIHELEKDLEITIDYEYRIYESQEVDFEETK